MLNLVVDGRYPAGPIRRTRILLGFMGLFLAWDTLFALREAAQGIPIRTFRSLSRLDGAAIAVVTALIVVASVLVLLDRVTRLGAAVLGVTFIATMLGEQQAYSNHLVLATTLVLLFALLPRPDADGTVPYWPVFLLRLQLATLYFYTAIAKMNGEYLTGKPLKWGTVDVIGGRIPEKVFVVISIGVLLLELALAFALWVPRWRLPFMALGVTMHLGIAVFGKGPVELIPFQLAVFAVYVLFATDPLPIGARLERVELGVEPTG